MDTKIVQIVKTVYFTVLGVMMYYFITQALNLGVFMTYRHAFALALFASAFAVFLYKPNIARGITAAKDALVYSLPLIVTILASLLIWFTQRVDTEVISRGLSGAFIYTNMISFSMAAAAFLYVFGEKGIWYNLVAILIANLLMIGTIILEYGFGSYFSELISLITSFAAVTGDIIVQAEVHELAFCLGAYLIFMGLRPRKNLVFYILLALTLFCFLSAFKRIGIIAIVVALGLGWSLRIIEKFNPKTARNLTIGLSVLVALLLIAYIALIKMDIFTLLEEAGVDTSGRVKIYDSVDKFYEFSPEFLGNGIGFLTYQLSTNINVGVSSVHNDFLQYFIDLGFWGYLLWLFAMTTVRVCYFGAKENTDNAILVLALMVYLVIASSTDNTINFPLLTTVLAVLMIGSGFDGRVRATEMKMFGYVSEENAEKEEKALL